MILTIVVPTTSRRRPWIHNGESWTRPTSAWLELREEPIKTALSPWFNPTGERTWIPGPRWFELESTRGVNSTERWQSRGPVTVVRRVAVSVITGEWVQTRGTFR